MRITATSTQLKVAVRVPGRFYGDTRGNGETGHFDNGTNTSYPFDEVLVNPGEAYNVPAGAEVVFVKEMGVAPAAPGEAQFADAGG